MKHPSYLAPGRRDGGLLSTTRRTALLTAALAALLFALWASPPPAVASHYRLPADGLVSDAEHDVLRKAGVTTTLHLFRRAAKTDDRKKLAQTTGIAYERLTELARRIDLMRVTGIGPSMAALLTAAGIPTLAELRALSADAAAARLEATNRAEGIAPVVPDTATVADWIAQAKKLAGVLEVDG